ncbi:MAG: hypothetical protein IJW79_08040 [Clostridia bacterium]|nr:hypothetical protein [Clostridia bacterium]
MTDLTENIKKYALSVGADLVGVADLKRWKSAPFNRTPMALMPDCTAAVVMGFHYLDACVELGGQPDMRFPGPAVSNHIASEHGNYAAFKLCKFIEKSGYDALMVPATGWWNYRENEASPRGFSADITHYYAACAAGLGEIGWNNLCLTPEFGPRQRFITVVTNAPIVPDPMYNGTKLCDGCKLCEKHCPGEVFTKESNGTLTVDFGDKAYTFKHKNLWRCALGENFQLDSFMKRPEICNEESISKLCEEWAEGGEEKRFSWKMGNCLKWCMTHDRRIFDRSFTSSPRRKRDVIANYSENGIKNALSLIGELCEKIEISKIIIFNNETLLKNNVSIKNHLPTAESAILVIQYYPENCEGDSARECARNALWLAKHLEIRGGYDTIVESGLNAIQMAGLYEGKISDTPYQVQLILTSIPFENTTREFEKEINPASTPTELTKQIKETAALYGAELCGISSAERIDGVAKQLDKIYADDDYFISVEQGYGAKANRMIDMKGKPKNPKIEEVTTKALNTKDYVSDAKSVIVVGLSMLDGSVKNVLKPPAYKAAHYGATVHKEMIFENRATAMKICKLLHQNGYKAYITDDLLGFSSKAYSFMLPDIRANALPAVCAGLGFLGKNGLAVNEKYGSRVRYVAIVTDTPLDCDPLANSEKSKCTSCDKCIKACPALALDNDNIFKLDIDGVKYEMIKPDRLKCDWAMRYGLIKEAGPVALGSLNSFPVPEIVTRENLLSAIKESDRLQIQNFAPIVEGCMLKCPYNSYEEAEKC